MGETAGIRYRKIMGIILWIAGKAKPILVRVLPIQLLRAIKNRMVNKVMSELSKQPDIVPFSRTARPDGINLIGYAKTESGLGESCRLTALCIDLVKIPFTVYDYKAVGAIRHNDCSLDYKVTNTAPYNINMFSMSMYELPLAYVKLGKDLWSGRYNIGFWAWELEKFPPEWENAFLLVDEIWTPSEFASKSIRGATSKPVCTMPHALYTPECGNYWRQDFNLPSDKFLFLCMYDSTSTFERKNPLGAIRAFKLAFSKDASDVGLVVKISYGDKRDVREINGEMAGYQNIHLITDTLDRVKANALIGCVDVYISLHRSEGFGLVMAEAMMLGTPVIATNWSGNTEFMDSTMACMVDYEFSVIKHDTGAYKAGRRWAEPDTAHAADYMKKLHGDKKFRTELAQKAKAHAEIHLSPNRIGAMMKKRIEEIYETVGS